MTTTSPSAALATLLLALPCACMAPVHMIVPPDVAEKGELIAVTDRSNSSGMLADESFVLGEYRVQKVDRSVITGEREKISRPLVPDSWPERQEERYKYEDRRHFSFELRSATDTLAAQCQQRAWGVVEETANAHLSCRCGSDASFEIERTSTASGALTLTGARFPLAPLYGTEGGGGETFQMLVRGNAASGYRVDGEALLGAVEVLHPGRIWLGRGISPQARQQLSCLFAGLLLDGGTEE